MRSWLACKWLWLISNRAGEEKKQKINPYSSSGIVGNSSNVIKINRELMIPPVWRRAAYGYCENVGNTTAAAATTTNNPALVLFHRYARSREVILGTEENVDNTKGVHRTRTGTHTYTTHTHNRGYTSRAHRLRTHSPARASHTVGGFVVPTCTVIPPISRRRTTTTTVTVISVRPFAFFAHFQFFFFLLTVVPSVRAGRTFPL